MRPLMLLSLFIRIGPNVLIYSTLLIRCHFVFYDEGGFYSDEVGYVGRSCKKCPNGSFVGPDEAPGTQAADCKTCPLGM